MNRHDALLRPLAEHLHLPASEIHVGRKQTGRLGHAGAACVQEFQQSEVPRIHGRLFALAPGRVALAVHRQQLHHVRRPDDVRQALRLFGPLQNARGVLVGDAGDVEPAEEAAQRRQAAVHRGARVLCAVELAQVTAQLAMRGSEDVDALAARPTREVHKIDAVGAQRVHRGVALHAHGVAKRVDQLDDARIAVERVDAQGRRGTVCSHEDASGRAAASDERPRAASSALYAASASAPRSA